MSYIYNSIPLFPIRKFYRKGKIMNYYRDNLEYVSIMGILAVSDKRVNNSNQFKQKGNILTYIINNIGVVWDLRIDWCSGLVIS